MKIKLHKMSKLNSIIKFWWWQDIWKTTENYARI